MIKGRHQWGLGIVAAGLLVALLAIAWLQIRFIDRLHRVETESHQAGLEAGLDAFRLAFDKELISWQLRLQGASPKLDALGRSVESADSVDLEALVGAGWLRDLWLGAFYLDTAAAPNDPKDAAPQWRPLGPLKIPTESDDEWPTPEQIYERHRTTASGLPIPINETALAIHIPLSPPLEDLELGAVDRLALQIREPRHVIVLVDRRRFAEDFVAPLIRSHLPFGGQSFDYVLALVPSSASQAEQSAAGDPDSTESSISDAANQDEIAEETLFASSRALTYRDLAPADAEIRLLSPENQAAAILNGARVQDSDRGPCSEILEAIREDPGALLAGELPLQELDPAQPRERASTSGSREPDEHLDTAATSLSFEIPAECETATFPTIYLRGGAGGLSWVLAARSRAGSLATALGQLRTRNLALSLVSLALLAASLALLGVLVWRNEKLSRAQLAFVAGVSHDLRTPIAVIQQAASNLADGVIAEPEDVRGYGSLVRREGKRLQEMIERLLTYAGLGTQRIPISAVAIAPLLDRVIENMSGEINERDLIIQTDLPPSLPPLKANAAALESALQNLLSNAIKYGADGGRVLIDAALEPRAGEPEVRISVRDWGPGIPVADRRHLFEPFYRGRRALESQLPGTGLGLSLVQRVAQTLGGRVRYEQPAGGGAIFHLHLPASPETSP